MRAVVRSGVWRELTALGYYPVVVNSTITYRRSLDPWQAYELESRIVGIVPVCKLVELFGLDPDHHPLPPWLAEWSSNAALPSRREPAPSTWR